MNLTCARKKGAHFHLNKRFSCNFSHDDWCLTFFSFNFVFSVKVERPGPAKRSTACNHCYISSALTLFRIQRNHSHADGSGSAQHSTFVRLYTLNPVSVAHDSHSHLPRGWLVMAGWWQVMWNPRSHESQNSILSLTRRGPVNRYPTILWRWKLIVGSGVKEPNAYLDNKYSSY